MTKRTLGILLSGAVTIVVMVHVVRYLDQRSLPLVAISLGAFWTARVASAVMERVLFPSVSLMFYEDVLRDLTVYTMLALVTAAAIWVNHYVVGTDVSPLGPAIAIHVLRLLFRRDSR